jgi:hypothetical protein
MSNAMTAAKTNTHDHGNAGSVQDQDHDQDHCGFRRSAGALASGGGSEKE